MRLLNCVTMCMKVWHGSSIPPYIILSHRWENEDEEVTLQDFMAGTAQAKYGYRKIEELCRIARSHHCEWVWLDTCCIDKTNSVELNEAINSMYNWYQNSVLCVAYLFDFRAGGNDDLGDSSWFRRCWTLQELISPRVVEFYDRRWSFFGTKEGLCQDIADITGVDRRTLSGADPRRCSVAQRMSWAAGREATRIEDQAYSLLGLFDISLPMLYGDGEKAFLALQNQILQYSTDSNDQSIFAWSRGLKDGDYYGLLAKSPSAFAECNATRCTAPIEKTYGFSFTGAGIQLNAPTIPYGMNTYAVAIACTSARLKDCERDCILLERSAEDGQFSRVCRGNVTVVSVRISVLSSHLAMRQRKLYVQQIPRHLPISIIHGFRLKYTDLPDLSRREHQDIQLCSRDQECLEPASTSSILAIPMTKSGTAGIIHFPQPEIFYHDEQIRCMKLGFDAENEPVCLLGNNKSMNHPYMQELECFENEPSTIRWVNDWIYKDWLLSERMARFTFDDDGEPEVFNFRDYMSQSWKKRDQANRVNLGLWGYMDVTCNLEDCPPAIDARSLPRCGPGPWQIWTVEIQGTGSFRKDCDENRAIEGWEQREEKSHEKRNDNIKMLAALGVASWCFRKALKEKERKE